MTMEENAADGNHTAIPRWTCGILPYAKERPVNIDKALRLASKLRKKFCCIFTKSSRPEISPGTQTTILAFHEQGLVGIEFQPQANAPIACSSLAAARGTKKKKASSLHCYACGRNSNESKRRSGEVKHAGEENTGESCLIVGKIVGNYSNRLP